MITLSMDLIHRSVAYAEQNLLDDNARHLQVDKTFIRDNFNLTGKRVLDFGCGMGGMSLWYARNWDCFVHGVDIDGHHVAIANHLKIKYNAQKILLEKRDITQDRLADKYDAVFLNDVAEHIPYPILTKIFTEIYLSLGAKGRVFVSYPPWQGPYASHVQRVTHLPWCQFLPEKLLLYWVKRKNMTITGEHESDLVEAYKGLNHLTHERLMAVVEPLGFKIEKRVSHSILKRLPILRGVNANIFPFNFLVSKEILILTK